MENLTIPVSSAIAKAYNGADFETRKKTEILVNIYLQQILKPIPSRDRLITVLNKGTAEAKEKGFIPNQLDDLLKDE